MALECGGNSHSPARQQQRVDNLAPGVEAELVLDRTPFYAETGGQIGDRGRSINQSGEKVADVVDTYAPVPGLSVHKVSTTAPLHTGDRLRAQVDAPAARSTMRNHTATHLLHAALAQTCSASMSSRPAASSSRRVCASTFTHYTAMDAEEIAEVERLMNEEILANKRREQRIVMDLDQALATGAMALFGEKYGDQVRVVSIDGFSKELCGGTHVNRTGDIGLCKVIYEGSISAGVRRIEAITGEGALRRFQETSGTLNRVVQALRASEPELIEHVEKLVTHHKNLERQVEQLKTRLAQAQVGELEQQARDVKGVKVLAARRRPGPPAAQRLGRRATQQLEDRGGRAGLRRGRQHRHRIRGDQGPDRQGARGQTGRAVAQAVGGKGGGRPDMAEAGGKDVSALAAALEQVYASVESML